MNSPKKPDSQKTRTGFPEDRVSDAGLGSTWGEILRRNNMSAIVAWLLDAGRPVAFISSQLLYMGRPFLGADAERVARILESDEAADAFADNLRSTPRPDSSRGGGRT
jgi:hypothetical protein